MNETVRVLGICGSLRKGSYNRALLRAAQRAAPDGMTIELFELRDLPLYDGDVEARGDPPPVLAFKEAVHAADALLIATPEYQHGIPGVLKNALDWASRPADGSVLQGKTAAIIGASPGMTGTVRAQMQLRQTLAFSEVYTVLEPEVLVGRVREKVNEAGEFVDETALAFLRTLLENLATLTRALGATHRATDSS
ncbi:MAG: NAD(P)H-dependent oxidoreductase [Candidatus Eremiobacteraeota bacterium]|nr:NAD(P)H-dependent oxidoreductase [Candidatus Eremiobacteraeota bacterium]